MQSPAPPFRPHASLIRNAEGDKVALRRTLASARAAALAADQLERAATPEQSR